MSLHFINRSKILLNGIVLLLGVYQFIYSQSSFCPYNNNFFDLSIGPYVRPNYTGSCPPFLVGHFNPGYKPGCNTRHGLIWEEIPMTGCFNHYTILRRIEMELIFPLGLTMTDYSENTLYQLIETTILPDGSTKYKFRGDRTANWDDTWGFSINLFADIDLRGGQYIHWSTIGEYWETGNNTDWRDDHWEPNLDSGIILIGEIIHNWPVDPKKEPDLVIESLLVPDLDNALGTDTRWGAIVTNIGEAVCQQYTAILSVSATLAPWLANQQNFERAGPPKHGYNLYPGESDTIYFNHINDRDDSKDGPAYWLTKFVVDPENDVNELNEENNEYIIRQVFGWYEEITYQYFPWPVPGPLNNLISSVLNEPRNTSTNRSISGRFHKGTDIAKAQNTPVMASSSGKIDNNLNISNIRFNTENYNYVHVKEWVNYSKWKNRKKGRWIIGRGDTIAKIDEEGHLHFEDYTRSIITNDQQDSHAINALRPNGLNPRDNDQYSPEFDEDTPLRFRINGSDTFLEPINLHGTFDMIMKAKDKASFNQYRAGIYKFRWIISNSDGNILTKDWVTIGENEINENDYFNVYSELRNSDMDEFFSMVITNKVERPGLYDEGPYRASMEPINSLLLENGLYTLKVWIEDVKGNSAFHEELIRIMN